MLSKNIASNLSIKRLCTKIGIERIGHDVYDEVNKIINKQFIFLINTSLKFADYAHIKTNRITLKEDDVKNAIEKYEKKFGISLKKTIPPLKVPSKKNLKIFSEQAFLNRIKTYLASRNTKIKRISKNASALIKIIIEEYLTLLMKCAKLNTIHRAKTTVTTKDIILAKKIRNVL